MSMGNVGKIVIIDDKERDAFLIKKEVLKYFQNDEIIILTKFDTNFLFDNKIDLLILDVQLGYHNGINELKAIQNSINYKIQVIVTSTYEAYVFDAFEVRPIGFCRKDHLEEDFYIMVKRLNEIGFRKEIKVNNTFIRINTIMYAESHLRHVVFFINNGERIEASKKIAICEEELKDYNFCRCHQSFLINLEYIAHIIKDTVILKSGKMLPISRKYSHNFVKKCETCKISG